MYVGGTVSGIQEWAEGRVNTKSDFRVGLDAGGKGKIDANMGRGD